jgi:vacuolar protein sorting-associated protein 54
LQSFHQIRISRSAKLVEDELWNPKEVTPGLQHLTDLLVDSAVRDPPDLIIKSDDTIFSPVTTDFPSPTPTSSNGKSTIVKSFSNALSKLSSGNGSATTAAAAASTSSKHLRIEDRTYYVVLATSEVLTLLMDYLRVVVNLSMLTTDAMSRVIEFLKSFNSRTCQVVLGAGAMRSAGLKNISAKHLGSIFSHHRDLYLFTETVFCYCFLFSSCVTISVYRFRTHSLRSRNVPTPSQSEASRHAG